MKIWHQSQTAGPEERGSPGSWASRTHCWISNVPNKPARQTSYLPARNVARTKLRPETVATHPAADAVPQTPRLFSGQTLRLPETWETNWWKCVRHKVRENPFNGNKGDHWNWREKKEGETATVISYQFYLKSIESFSNIAGRAPHWELAPKAGQLTKMSIWPF